MDSFPDFLVVVFPLAWLLSCIGARESEAVADADGM